MTDVILVSGVSGSGKTRLIETKYREYPHLDIADVYRDLPNAGWYQVTIALATKTRKMAQKHDVPIVVEGYFIPGSASRSLFLNEIGELEVKSIFCHAPKDVCARRVKESGEDVELRLDILERVYDSADKAMREWD